MRPTVSVVIPVFNGARLVADTLRELDREREALEILIVDNGSTDGTPEIVQGLPLSVPLRLLRQRRQGRAAARNLGAAHAAAPTLLFMDADVRPAPGCIAAHLRHHAGTPVAVQGRTLQHPSTLTTLFMRATNAMPPPSTQPRPDLPPMHVNMRNFSVSTAAFRAVGGFDEGFRGFGWEDVELGFRLRQAGVPLRYEPDAFAYHYHVEDLPARARKFREAGAAAVYFWRKHGRSPRLGLLLEVHPVLLPLKWLIYRAGALTWLLETLRPWAEERGLVPLCSECYNHLLWRAYYEGVFAARRNGRPATGPEMS